jgi:hypothetical protein
MNIVSSHNGTCSTETHCTVFDPLGTIHTGFFDCGLGLAGSALSLGETNVAADNDPMGTIADDDADAELAVDKDKYMAEEDMLADNRPTNIY